ncbi:unnamed protein product [Effrenium voratum]|nr:unnamed protein product [Effrenium voratum]
MRDDGSITRSELRKGLEEIGVEIEPAAFKSLMGYLDRDSGGTVNLKELDRGIKQAVRERYGKETLALTPTSSLSTSCSKR